MSSAAQQPSSPRPNLGKAYEYALAASLSALTNGSLVESPQLNSAHDNFDRAGTAYQYSMLRSSERAVEFLVANDSILRGHALSIALQTDQQGQAGDVRDILVTNHDTGSEVGISAKHRNSAIKHSRLSGTIDFGQEWVGIPSSEQYFEEITPVFLELDNLRREGKYWRDIPRKADRFYVPVLDAFESEVRRLVQVNELDVAQGILRYLLGRSDFYKIIKVNGTTRLQSFNLYGTLGWGPRLRLPTEIGRVRRKPGSKNTTHIEFDQGWQVSLRIHSAESRVIPSLKFDIKLIGHPQTLATNTIYHMRD